MDEIVDNSWPSNTKEVNLKPNKTTFYSSCEPDFNENIIYDYEASNTVVVNATLENSKYSRLGTKRFYTINENFEQIEVSDFEIRFKIYNSNDNKIILNGTGKNSNAVISVFNKGVDFEEKECFASITCLVDIKIFNTLKESFILNMNFDTICFEFIQHPNDPNLGKQQGYGEKYLIEKGKGLTARLISINFSKSY